MSKALENSADLLYRVSGLDFSYTLGKHEVKALKNVNFEMKRGELIGLAGPSGSGKSTLLNCLGLLEKVDSGRVYFSGKDVTSFDDAGLTNVRLHELGYIFQNFLLFPNLSAFENTEYFLARQGLSKKERKEIAEQALVDVGLKDKLQVKPAELSGGQRQRVAIARALAKRPSILIADEPTASLDQKTGAEILDLLFGLNESKKVSIVISSHDPQVLGRLRKTVHLKDGVISQIEEKRS